MPKLVRWYLKTGLIYLAAALGLGVFLTLSPTLGAAAAGWFPAYVHLLVVGWVSQIIMGVAIWMFPKYTQQRPRGSEIMLWTIYVLLNLGLGLRVLAEPLAGARPGWPWGWALIMSAGMQWLAAVLFVVSAWPRVKER